MEALDAVAEKAGYNNFRFAQRALSLTAKRDILEKVEPGLFLTAYWQDESGSGRETAELRTTGDWLSGVTQGQLDCSRALSHFCWDCEDHLEARAIFGSQDGALKLIAHAIRELEFMNVSGLAPSAPALTRTPAWKAFANAVRRYVPKKVLDHSTSWQSRTTGNFFITGEPYGVSLEGVHVEMAICEPEWPSIYSPKYANLFLISDETSRNELTRIANAFKEERPNFFDASTQSASFKPIFMSPRKIESGARRIRHRHQLNAPGMAWSQLLAGA